MIAVAGIGAAVMLGAPGGVLAAAASIAVLFVYGRAPAGRPRRWLALVAVLVLAQAVFWYLLNRGGDFAIREVFARHASFIPIYLRDPLLLSMSAALFMFAWVRSTRSLHPAMMMLAGLAVGAGGADWLAIRAADASMHSAMAEASAIRARLPSEGSVYWSGSALVPWLVLGYPSYISDIQTAGIVFSRETAMEAARRNRLVEGVLGPQAFMRWQLPAEGAGATRKDPDFAAAATLCADRALAGVYVPGMGAEVRGVAIRDAAGTAVGRFVSCEERREGS
jgi:hypothetical protein